MTPTEHLDGLAVALAAAGWSTSARYEGRPALIHVFAAAAPDIGESVYVKPGVGGVPWFISSTGDPLRPCHDVAGTVAALAERVQPLAEAALLDEPPRPSLVARIRALVAPS